MARDSKGRWLPGTSGNPKGGAICKTEEIDLPLLRKLLTPEVEEEIYRVAIARAKAGDRHARAFLWAYLYGKPIERRITAEAGDITLEWDDDNEDQGTETAS